MKRFQRVSVGMAMLFGLAAAPVLGQVNVSVRGGASLATLGGSAADSIPSKGNRTGLNVGATATFGLSENMGLQLGLGYAQKGVAMSEAGAEITFGLDYIEVPVLLQIGIPTQGSFSPHVYLGGSVAFESKCEIGVSFGGISGAVACDEPASEFQLATKSTEFGAVGGVGASIAAGESLSITLDVLYNLGLSSVDDSTPAESLKNRAWSFLAGVSFPLGG